MLLDQLRTLQHWVDQDMCVLCTKENIQLVAEAFVHSPGKSSRWASVEREISLPTILRMLKSIG